MHARGEREPLEAVDLIVEERGAGRTGIFDDPAGVEHEHQVA
jgi:hypothetical protein